MYGVHLREGLRSYLANGYLVAMNYPEVCCTTPTLEALASLFRSKQFTQTSIERKLVSLPMYQQKQCVRAIHELRPLLETFGMDLVGNGSLCAALLVLQKECMNEQTPDKKLQKSLNKGTISNVI